MCLPLDVVQIDHTVSDVRVVDDLYRQPIGRPYLTIALDVASRSVLAAVLSFDAPGAATVALTLERAARSKDNWLASLGLPVGWLMAGLPHCLHVDNAPEFHSKALVRGCAQFGIELAWRPVGRPHFGGHVERSIGTLISRFKSLPGATGSNPVERKTRRRPEKTATMTLGELERWLVVEIAERYHHRPHKLPSTAARSAWMPCPQRHACHGSILWQWHRPVAAPAGPKSSGPARVAWGTRRRLVNRSRGSGPG